MPIIVVWRYPELDGFSECWCSFGGGVSIFRRNRGIVFYLDIVGMFWEVTQSCTSDFYMACISHSTFRDLPPVCYADPGEPFEAPVRSRTDETDL